MNSYTASHQIQVLVSKRISQNVWRETRVTIKELPAFLAFSYKLVAE